MKFLLLFPRANNNIIDAISVPINNAREKEKEVEIVSSSSVWSTNVNFLHAHHCFTSFFFFFFTIFNFFWKCVENWPSTLDQCVFVRNWSCFIWFLCWFWVWILNFNKKIGLCLKMELVYDCECTRVYGSDQSPMFYNFVENWVTPVWIVVICWKLGYSTVNCWKLGFCSVNCWKLGFCSVNWRIVHWFLSLLLWIGALYCSWLWF